ncbi:MAG: glycosyltransferase family 2 protein [Balneolales bacterium]|nr:glycosyltransferase family 2 protein [Balneolales bacterium]
MADLFIYGFITIQLIVAFYLILPFLYNILALIMPVQLGDIAIAAKPGNSRSFSPEDRETGIACVITAYKEKEFAFLLIDSLIKQKYSNYHIYLVADRCEKEPTDPEHPLLTIIYPESPLDSKVKSLRLALDSINPINHEYTLVFDPDNLAHEDLLQELNQFMLLGFEVIQARRTAKNLNTAYACIDAAGEYYYHVTQRMAPFRMGSSATIAGSGMAVKTTYYAEHTQRTLEAAKEGEVISAEDKILQSELIRDGFTIAYAANAVLFDEKVASGEQVQRQRTRWISSWFSYYREALSLTFWGVKNVSSNAFFFGLMISIPPLFILGAGGLLLVAAAWVFTSSVAIYISAAWVLFTLNFLASLKAASADSRVWKALLSVPLFVFRQVLALVRIRQAKTSFMETTHQKKLTIEEVVSDMNITRKYKF